MTRKSTSTSLPRQFTATWTHTKVYHFTAAHFNDACAKALADPTLYTSQGPGELTIRQTLPPKEPN